MTRALRVALVSYYSHMEVGLGTYARGLLAGIETLDCPHRFTAVTPRPRLTGFERVDTITLPVPVPPLTPGLPLIYWDQLAAWSAVKLMRPDIVHWLQPRTSLVPAARRTVMTLADAIPWADARYGRALEHGYARTYAGMARRADMVITISHHAAHDIAERLRIDKERIVVTHLAAEPAIDDAAARPLVDQPYVLFVGGSDRRKNGVRTIQAFARATLPDAVRLVVVGWLRPAGDDHDDLAACVAALPAATRERIVLLDHVDDAQLNALYRAATVCAFPSLYEGFGLPVLEAMQRGVPVITSATTSLPEVAGDAAKLIDPTDVDALTRALEELVGDPRRRADLAERGLAQAKTFTWEATAAATVAAYERLVGEAPSARLQ
ncbi:MAG: glycosyltransferase family 1 protein [Solirubrobacteraceae bacterium]|jgi:alpha-1,3-rhamnosyl/mannosyltransferase